MNYYDVDRLNACTDIYVCAIGNGIPCHAYNLSCYELGNGSHYESEV